MSSTSLRSIVFLAVLCVTAPASGSSGPELRGTLRIRLMEQLAPQRATVEAGPHGLAVYGDDDSRPLFTVPGGGHVSLERSGESVRIQGSGGQSSSGQLRLEPQGPGDMTIRVGNTSRAYAGSLLVTARAGESSLRLINHVPLEDYVASVVASEYGLPDLEGSKAMAVIARTYGLKVINSADDTYDHVDDTASQVYRGSRAVTPLALEAARATAGQVLTHNGRLIEAVYSSSSGGHTANNEDVWQAGPHPYLRGRPDPWDERSSPHGSWEFSVSERDLHHLIKETLGLDLKALSIEEESAEGRARTIRLEPKRGKTRTIPGEEFRRIVREKYGIKSIRSTRFSMNHRRGQYTFRGSGFGHGIGLSQYGAHGMATAGKDYREILNFYYANVQLEQRGTPAPASTAGFVLAAKASPPPDDALKGRFMPGRSGPVVTQPVSPARSAPIETRASKPSTTAAWNSSRSNTPPKSRRGW